MFLFPPYDGNGNVALSVLQIKYVLQVKLAIGKITFRLN
jgi:hypothetical protein